MSNASSSSAAVSSETAPRRNARDGHRVTVIERAPEQRRVAGECGYDCAEPFIPLAAPGMVALGLKWMWNPESPFYIKPRWLGTGAWALRDLAGASTRAHVERSAPCCAIPSRQPRSLRGLAEEWQDFGLVKGPAHAVQDAQRSTKKAHTAAKARELGAAEVLDAGRPRVLDQAA